MLLLNAFLFSSSDAVFTVSLRPTQGTRGHIPHEEIHKSTYFKNSKLNGGMFAAQRKEKGKCFLNSFHVKVVNPLKGRRTPDDILPSAWKNKWTKVWGHLMFSSERNVSRVEREQRWERGALHASLMSSSNISPFRSVFLFCFYWTWRNMQPLWFLIFVASSSFMEM